MYLRMGNLTVEQFEAAVGTSFTAEERRELERHRTDQANFTDESKFHIFNDPAVNVVVGDAAHEVIEPIMLGAHERAPFRRAVSFYPIPK